MLRLCRLPPPQLSAASPFDWASGALEHRHHHAVDHESGYGGSFAQRQQRRVRSPKRRAETSESLVRPVNRSVVAVLVIAVLNFLGTSCIEPALAWDGPNGFGMAGFPSAFATHLPQTAVRSRVMPPRNMARRIDAQNGLRFRRHAQLRNGLPVLTLPYSSSIGMTTVDVPSVQNGRPSDPPVFVMSQLPNRAPERTAPETPPDYGYVAGCRAIPNGYHCDMPHDGAAAAPGG
jgi:hypothetical protein